MLMENCNEIIKNYSDSLSAYLALSKKKKNDAIFSNSLKIKH